MKAFFVTRVFASLLALLLLTGTAESPLGKIYQPYDNRDFLDVKRPTFSKDDLVQLIQSSGAKSLADLLPNLPNSIRSQAILVFKSGSLQQGSYLLPRILLFNEDASLVITFNGEASQFGFETLEVMNFNFQTYSFEFEEFVFSDDLEARQAYLQSKDLQDEIKGLYDRSTRTGVNAQACLACHRVKPRPNWEAYPFWPGVYGQAHPNSLNPLSNHDQDDYGPEERDYLGLLVATYEGNPRYKHVTFFEKLKIFADEVSRTNVLFNTLLSRLNFLRLLKDVKCHPNFREFEKHESFIRDYEELNVLSLKRLQTSKSEYAALVEEIREKQLNSYFRNAVVMAETLKQFKPATQLERMPKLFHNLTESTARFQLVMKKVLNMDLMDYEMSLVRGTYLFVNGSTGILDFFKVKKRYADSIQCSY